VLRPIFTLSCLLLSIGLIRGQAYIADTTFVADAKKNAVKLYTARLGVVSNVYNGSEYAEYRPQRDENPYLTPDWIYGSVNYGGEQYESIPLLLDIANDELITMYASGNAIQMIREKVRSFKLEDRTFARLTNSQVSPGFYELMYDGKVKYYAKRQKTLYQKLNGTSLMNIFETSNTHYIVKNGTFHTFRTRGALLKVLGDHKAELKKFIREQRLPFGANREKSTVSVLAYYDQLSR
jgi:hypothetical protein